jgi:hypothetical protein
MAGVVAHEPRDAKLRGELQTLSAMVLSEFKQLAESDQQLFLREYDRRRKSGWWAWPLWLIGWHYAYFGRWGRQFVYLLGTAMTLGIWWLVEGIILPRRLRDQRTEAAISALRDLRAIRSSHEHESL